MNESVVSRNGLEQIMPKIHPVSVRTSWLKDDDCRMDAYYYNAEAISVLKSIIGGELDTKKLGDPEVTKTIFNLSRFKRIYTNDRTKGHPYLSAYEVFMFRPQSERWIPTDKLPTNPDRHFVKEGWTLVYCSGINVGRCVMATKRLEQFFLTHDLIRIAPVLPSGYLYAFLASSLGKALMSGRQYGAAIPHLEPHHIASIPIPILSSEQQQSIHEKIMQACRLRDEANGLIDEAEDLLYKELNLSQFDESYVPYLGSDKPKAFVLNISELADRFDASYHIPIAKTCVDQMQKGRYPLIRLSDISERIFIPPRFKRIYVPSDHGVPFLQGSHIPLIMPYDMKYISNSAYDDLSPWIIQENWVLVTCSGTIGRIALVPKIQDGWAATQHIERIIPKPNRGHPGYIAMFLMTPYGQHQLKSKIYGAVVDELTEDDTYSIWIPDAPYEVQEAIGKLAMRAFEMKEEANQIEHKAIRYLEETIMNSSSGIDVPR